MNRRNIIFALIAAFTLITIIAIGYSWYSVEPPLTVHLRCDGEVSGTLSANIILPNGKSAKTENFDIQKVCKNGKIEFDDYQREKKLQFTFEPNRGEKFKIVSEYGRDIQSDQNGFYMVLKITNVPPFIANDSI